MSQPIVPKFEDLDIDRLAKLTGMIVVLVPATGTMDVGTRRVNKLMKGTLKNFITRTEFEEMKTGAATTFNAPLGMDASGVVLLKSAARPSVDHLRDLGATAAKAIGHSDVHLLLAKPYKVEELLFGLSLRRYQFTYHKTADDKPYGAVTALTNKPAETAAAYSNLDAVAQGVFFTRDLVNEPANVLTTSDFADRLVALKDLGVTVKVLEEADMEKLGMGSLLSVGHGSKSPTKLVCMEWNGGGDEPTFALVGKGVVFDTGGISLKPGAGMEDMTMDMGGAGVVAGVMKTLALRKAQANIVGIVGLVENMPDALSTRPGDVVKSMKGDTIEVINTDAEGRLVLADALWYCQETYNPTGIIDLATLTGAIIIGLGHDNAGVFSNDDTLSANFLKAADVEQEGAWRMPLGAGYDKLIESRIADIKNVGGRAAGSITAAQFLQRFVKPDMPWIHLDIAGVASVKSETALAPTGATGWGVMALNRLITDMFES